MPVAGIGMFITLEGVEGAGKSSAVPVIDDYLQQQGYDTVLTREPGGTDVAEAIREVLLSTALPAMHIETELMLMFAARLEHLQKKILPALAEGKVVVCDRFTDASYAYQGAGRGLPVERIQALESWVQGGVKPDLTLVFDVDAAVGLARAKGFSQGDRIEQENIDFFNRVRQAYQAMAEQTPQRYKLIDANQSIQKVEAQLLSQLKQTIGEA